MIAAEHPHDSTKTASGNQTLAWAYIEWEETVPLASTFALDMVGLPEAIYTNSRDGYLHLPGVILTENSSNHRCCLLPDGLGSTGQAIGGTTRIVAYPEFHPYGNPVNNTAGGEPYGAGHTRPAAATWRAGDHGRGPLNSARARSLVRWSYTRLSTIPVQMPHPRAEFAAWSKHPRYTSGLLVLFLDIFDVVKEVYNYPFSKAKSF